MAQEAISKICAAESEADACIAAARNAAKKILADAENSAQAAYDARVSEAEAEVAAMLEKAEDRAASASLEITASTERECEKLRVLAKGRMDDAAAFIAEKVVKG